MTPTVGVVTRGTTARRRLRRLDRWLLDTRPGLLSTSGLLAVDLGFGAVPTTTVELHRRLRAVNHTACVVGLEIDPQRARAAAPYAREGLTFDVGGFELAGLRPHVVRAANVLRQYDEADVATAWAHLTGALQPGGLAFDATFSETGRLGAWVTLDRSGPRAVTLACDLRTTPGEVATRLPKALIHHNVVGQPVHELLTELDRQWQRQRAVAVFSARQRFVAAARAVSAAGWPALDGPARWARGELTVAWAAVAPR